LSIQTTRWAVKFTWQFASKKKLTEVPLTKYEYRLLPYKKVLGQASLAILSV